MSAIEFPAVPRFRASWCPLFIEPVVGSGERFAFAVVAWQNTGAFAVARVLPQAKLRCMFGNRFRSVTDLIDLVVEEIDAYLKKTPNLIEWHSPIAGVFRGQISEAAAEDMEGIFHQAAAFCSSLSEAASIAVFGTDLSDAETQERSLRWNTLVKEAVLKKKPSLEPNFGKHVKPRADGATIRLGYYDGRYAANFGLIVPGNFSVSVKSSKASMWDLELMKRTDALFPPEKLDFIVGTPSYDDPTISSMGIAKIIETYQLIETHGKEQHIQVFRAENAITAAARILSTISK